MTDRIFDGLRQTMAAGLDLFAVDVLDWHLRNWPDRPLCGDPHHRHNGRCEVYASPARVIAQATSSVLGVTKVAEEAGELVGAVTRLVEGRPNLTIDEAIDNAYAELGDVVIAAAGALRRLNDLTGGSRTFADVVLDRWAGVRERDYRQEA